MEKEQIILKDPVVKFIKESWGKANFCDSLFLTGGAVIDILEGRKPKDYDFSINNFDVNKIIKEGVKMGLKFNYTSSTAVSFTWGHYSIQVLRKPITEFPFTIEQSKFSIHSGKLNYLDEVSFNSKRLIPNDKLVFVDKDLSRSQFLNRVRKWESKGYSIHPITRKSCLRVVKGKPFLFSLFSRGESKES